MKKNWLSDAFDLGVLKKTIRIMRILFVFVFGFSALVSANSYAQVTRLDIQMENRTIRDIMKYVEKNSEFVFLYKVEDVDLNKKVNIELRDATIQNITDKMFEGEDVVCNIYDRQIVVSKTEKLHVVQQQTKKITGTVIDRKGEAIPGVTVVIPGTTIGTVTELDGGFEIEIPESANYLQFSFVGMKTLKISTEGKQTFIVTMEQESIGLNEVVAIGYGTVKKADLTGAVSGFKSDAFENERPISAESLLAGRISGVKVTGGSQPGSGGSIVIRGANSMSGGIEPLYVIDGVPVVPNQDAASGRTGNEGGFTGTTTGLNFIDPEMIERIDVLKDASATAIYGSRGANGVVLITTKQGDKGFSRLNFTASLSVATVANEIDVLTSGEQFANQRNVAAENAAYLDRSWWDYQLLNNAELVNSGTLIGPSTMSSISGKTYQQYLDGTQNGVGGWVFGEGRDQPSANSPNLENTNWHDAVFQTAITQKYSLNYSGGSDAGNFSMGLNYLDQEGVLKGSSFTRLNLLLNANRNIGDRFKLISSINFSSAKANAAMTNNGNTAMNNVISQVSRYAPIVSVESDYLSSEFTVPNFTDTPLDLVEKLVDDKKLTSALSKVALSYNVLKGLDLEALGSYYVSLNERATYWPMSTMMGEAKSGDATSTYSKFEKYLFQTQATFNRKYGKHNINTIAVYAYEESHYNDLSAWVQNFPSDLLTYHALETGLNSSTPQNYYRDDVLLSGLGRMNYTYDERYLLTVSFRADGASKFASGRKWGYFPSGAFAWRVSEESFMENLDKISNLKLRTSYGKTGGQAISPYQTLSILTTKNYPYHNQPGVGYFMSNMPSPDLTWETTDQYNVGLDIGFWDNRLSLSMDLYYKQTHDLLMQVNLPPASGFSSVWDNIGKVENRGMEFEVFLSPLKNKQLQWNIIGNFSINKNKVLELGSSEYQYSSFGFQNQSWLIFKEGEPLCTFWGYETDGVFTSWEEVYSESNPMNAATNNYSTPTVMVGDIKYKDLSGPNGVPDGIITEDDKVSLGNPDPDALWGITNEFVYKGLSLSFLIDGQIGGELLNLERFYLESGKTSNTNRNSAYYENQYRPVTSERPEIFWKVYPDPDSEEFEFYYPAIDYENWDNYSSFGTQDPNTSYPMYSTYSTQGIHTYPSDRWVEDATFVKLRNVSLSYSLPKQVLRGTGASSVRLIFSASNLLTITNYSGYDPEISTYVNNPSRRGLDFGVYPLARTFTFGVNIGL